LVSDEADISLVNQGRGLERLPRLLPGEPLLGEPPELTVNEGEELLGRLGVAVLDG
jgi:hypothetical protein